jgi:hypothetical protein
VAIPNADDRIEDTLRGASPTSKSEHGERKLESKSSNLKHLLAHSPQAWADEKNSNFDTNSSPVRPLHRILEVKHDKQENGRCTPENESFELDSVGSGRGEPKQEDFVLAESKLNEKRKDLNSQPPIIPELHITRGDPDSPRALSITQRAKALNRTPTSGRKERYFNDDSANRNHEDSSNSAPSVTPPRNLWPQRAGQHSSIDDHDSPVMAEKASIREVDTPLNVPVRYQPRTRASIDDRKDFSRVPSQGQEARPESTHDDSSSHLHRSNNMRDDAKKLQPREQQEGSRIRTRFSRRIRLPTKLGSKDTDAIGLRTANLIDHSSGGHFQPNFQPKITFLDDVDVSKMQTKSSKFHAAIEDRKLDSFESKTKPKIRVIRPPRFGVGFGNLLGNENEKFLNTKVDDHLI